MTVGELRTLLENVDGDLIVAIRDRVANELSDEIIAVVTDKTHFMFDVSKYSWEEVGAETGERLVWPTVTIRTPLCKSNGEVEYIDIELPDLSK